MSTFVYPLGMGRLSSPSEKFLTLYSVERLDPIIDPEDPTIGSSPSRVSKLCDSWPGELPENVELVRDFEK